MTMTKTKGLYCDRPQNHSMHLWNVRSENRDPLNDKILWFADQKPDGEDHLPCGISIAERLWNTRQTTLFEVVQKIKEVNNTRRWKAFKQNIYRFVG